MFQLKKGQEAFTIMAGPDEGKTFRPGMTYDVPPIGYTNRFEKIQTSQAAKSKKQAKANKE